jgi:hypothetical protein
MVLFKGYRVDMGPFHGEQGRYGSCSWGTGEIWVLFMGNRGDMGPVYREQGRPGQGSGTGEEGVLFTGVKLERRESCS